jgi:nucleoid DNA-binding protein
MKMREWAKATYRALKERPAAEREKHFTLAQVEDVMQMSIQTLVESLAAGEALRLNDLGCMWVEVIPSRQVVSNLSGVPQVYEVDARKVVRFRASSRLLSLLNSNPPAEGRHLERERSPAAVRRAKATKVLERPGN